MSMINSETSKFQYEIRLKENGSVLAFNAYNNFKTEKESYDAARREIENLMVSQNKNREDYLLTLIEKLI